MPTIHIGLSNGSHFTLEGESPEAVWATIQKGESLDALYTPKPGEPTLPSGRALFNPAHVVIVNVV